MTNGESRPFQGKGRGGASDLAFLSTMPDVASNSLSVAFGNFNAGYLIVERAETVTKSYGDQQRRITRPAAGSVRVGVGGSERLSGWTLSGGTVNFAVAPAAGAAVTAGYRFDVPVRFAEDRLEVNRASFLAGEAPSVPLVEIREG